MTNITTPTPEVVKQAEQITTALEESGDGSAFVYHRSNEVMILTDTHAISVWNDSPGDPVQVAHRPFGAPGWNDGTP